MCKINQHNKFNIILKFTNVLFSSMSRSVLIRDNYCTSWARLGWRYRKYSTGHQYHLTEHWGTWWRNPKNCWCSLSSGGALGFCPGGPSWSEGGRKTFRVWSGKCGINQIGLILRDTTNSFYYKVKVSHKKVSILGWRPNCMICSNEFNFI